MDYFKNLVNNYSFTKREKILLIIFILLLFELCIYSFGFKVNKSKNLELENQIIKLSEENKDIEDEVLKIKKIKNINSKLISLNLDLNTYNNSLKNIYEEFPYIIEENPSNFKNLTFEIDANSINNIKNISNKNIFNNMVLEKKEQDLFVGRLDLKEIKNSLNIHKIDDKEKKNLEKYHFYKEKKYDIKDKEVVNEIVDKQNSTIKDKKNKENRNKENRNKENRNLKENESNNLNLVEEKENEVLGINLYSSNLEKSEISYIEDMYMYYLFLQLDSEVENIFLLEISDILNFKELSFDLFVEDKDLYEFGIYDGRRVYSEIKLEENKWNKIFFREVEDFKGIYFVYNTLNCSKNEYRLLIRDIKVEI